MKSYFKLLMLIFSITLFVSCGNADDDVNFGLNTGGDLGQGGPVDDCLDLGENDLILSIQDQYTTEPGKVSVFFKVSNADGSPVPGLTADEFTIYEQGQNDACFNTISKSEANSRISPNSQIFSNNTLLVLDLSASVLTTSLAELKTASASFIENVMPATPEESFKMAIYWFDGEDVLHELNPLTADKAELTAAVDSITVDISEDVSTDLYGAVIKSTDIASNLLAEGSKDEKISAASVVIFTDGTDQASRFTKEAAQKKVDTADPNISFFTIGLGGEIDRQVLTDIGKTSSVVADNKEELETTFNNISELVSRRASSFYLFEYCSPKRSGENNLAIQVKKGGVQGAVQTKFNAKGFSGGCE